MTAAPNPLDMAGVVERLEGRAGVDADWPIVQIERADLRALLSAFKARGEALEEFVREYDGFEDGNGFPCPTLAKARASITPIGG